MTERAYLSSARRSLMVICASASLSAQIPATNELLCMVKNESSATYLQR
jgi:hypothetical protein